MQVTFHALNRLYSPISIACGNLADLFNRFVNTIFRACWGKRVAKPVETPSTADIKVEQVVQKVIPAKNSFADSRFPRAMWDLSNGLAQKDLSFIDESEKTLTEEEKIQLRTHCKNIVDSSRALQHTNDKMKFKAFLRKLDGFDEYLKYMKDIFNKIRSGSASRDELKLEVRQIRQYFINRYTWFAGLTGHTNGGKVEPFVEEFYGPLFGETRGFADSYRLVDGQLINIYQSMKDSKLTQRKEWVAGFALQEGNHAVAYIYTKEGFVKLDNSFAENKIFSAEEIYKRLSDSPEDVLKLLSFPMDKNIDRLPDAKKWLTPAWERNNCFISASLIFLALCDYYNER